MRVPWPVALPIVAAVLAAGGCGKEESLTRAEYVEQADKICQDARDRQQELGAPKSIDDIERLADKTRPLLTDQLSKLRDLKAPKEIEKDAKAAYDLLARQVPKFDELVAAAKAKDVPRIQAIAAAADGLDKQANDKAKAIGLKTCGND